MQVLAPVIEITTLAMLYPWEHLALGRAIALPLVCHDDAGHLRYALEHRTKKLLGRLLVPTALHENIQQVTVLIDGTPQIMTLAV